MGLVWILRAEIDGAAMKKRICYGPGEPSNEAKSPCAKKRVCGVATARARRSDDRPRAFPTPSPMAGPLWVRYTALTSSRRYTLRRDRSPPGTANQLIV